MADTQPTRQVDADVDVDGKLKSAAEENSEHAEKGRPRVSGLFIYPIKSCGGIAVDSAAVTATGLQWDRQWMVVDASSRRFITQRQCAAMALIRTALPPEALLPPHTWAHTLPADACLYITAPGHPPLHVPLSLSWYRGERLGRRAGTKGEGRGGEGGGEGEREERGSEGRWVTVTVWGWTGRALDAGDDASEWFSRVMGRQVRLVRFDTAHVVRPTSPDFADGFQTSFADGYPMLLISQASLSSLNARLPHPVPMNRFRPNIVVSGCEPFDEDTWRSFSVAPYGHEASDKEARGRDHGSGSSDAAPVGVFRGVKPCSRCKITTIDQLTAESGKEPLQTFLKFRRGKDLGLQTSIQDVFFGMNVVFQPARSIDPTPALPAEQRSLALLSLGDEIDVLAADPRLATLYP